MSAVIFDLDGVLIDSEELHYRAYSELLREFGIAVPREVYAKEWIASGRGPEYAVAHMGLPISAAELRGRKAPVYRAILEREVRLMPGVMAALERLSAEWPLAVATNSGASDVDLVFSRFGIGRYFTAAISREKYARAKPEPDAFLAAAAALDQEPASCLVVEDAERGLVAAKAAGMRCVVVPHDFTRQSDFSAADRVLGSLDELTVDVVRSLVGGKAGSRLET